MLLVTPALTQIGTEQDPAVRLRQLWGTNIKRARELRGMSRADLADAVEVTEAAVGMWERGETSPRPHLQLAIARAVDTEHKLLFPVVAA